MRAEPALSKRNSRWSRVALCGCAAIAAATVLGAPGCETEEGQEASHGIHLRPVEWEYNGSTIHGIAVEGTTLHGTTTGADPKGLKILLMPMGWLETGVPENPLLDYRTPVMEAPDGKYIAINLRHGAAMADLGELSTEEASARIEVVLEAVKTGSTEALPGVSEKQFALWQRIIQEAGGIKDTEDVSRAMDHASPNRQERMQQTARMAAFAFWPMIFSYSVVAGSESTRVVLVSLPRTDANRHVVLARLIVGSSARLVVEPSPDEPITMVPDTNYTVELANGGPVVSTPEEPEEPVDPAPDGTAEMEHALAALAEGWTAVFGGEGDGP